MADIGKIVFGPVADHPRHFEVPTPADPVLATIADLQARAERAEAENVRRERNYMQQYELLGRVIAERDRLLEALRQLGDLNNWNANRNMWVRPDDPIAIARNAMRAGR